MSSEAAVTTEAADVVVPAEADPPADTAAPAAEQPAEEPAEEADEPTPNAEAAKWRTRLRDEQAAHKATQTALETLTGQMEALQRQQVENLIVAARVRPAAVWATTDLGALLAADGTVDPEAVAAAIDTARKTLGIQPLGKGAYVPGLGGQPDRPPQTDGWQQAFTPRR